MSISTILVARHCDWLLAVLQVAAREHPLAVHDPSFKLKPSGVLTPLTKPTGAAHERDLHAHDSLDSHIIYERYLGGIVHQA